MGAAVRSVLVLLLVAAGLALAPPPARADTGWSFGLGTGFGHDRGGYDWDRRWSRNWRGRDWDDRWDDRWRHAWRHDRWDRRWWGHRAYRPYDGYAGYGYGHGHGHSGFGTFFRLPLGTFGAPPPPPRVVAPSALPCVEYNGDAVVDATGEPFFGVACLGADGRWHIAR